jgi:hypothetical protein
MALKLEDLDPKTRDYMLDELERDRIEGRIYLSPWLSELGRTHYPDVLALAIRCGTEESLGGFVKGLLLETYNERRVPCNASTIIGESEFNRYYIRGLCRRAIEDNIPEASPQITPIICETLARPPRSPWRPLRSAGTMAPNTPIPTT